jgi:predicted hydrocarbon binding protein
MADVVDPLVPLMLLEAVRIVDTPDEDDTEIEFVEELRVKRLGLSDTVRAQIRRYEEAVRRGSSVSFEEATGIARLVGRRPDAEAVFREAGRRLARVVYGRVFAPTRWALRLLPGLLARPLALRQVRRASRRYLGGGIRRVGATILLEVPGTLSVGTAPRSGGCTFQEAMLREFIRQLLGVVGTVEHVRCRSREEGACEWRAEWRTIR